MVKHSAQLLEQFVKLALFFVKFSMDPATANLNNATAKQDKFYFSHAVAKIYWQPFRLIGIATRKL